MGYLKRHLRFDAHMKGMRVIRNKKAVCVFTHKDMMQALIAEMTCAGLDCEQFAMRELAHDAMEEALGRVVIAMNLAGFDVVRAVARQWAGACASEAHYDGLHG